VPRTFNPIKVHVVDLALAAVLVHQRERRAGDFLLARNAEARDNSLRQRRLAAAELAFEQHQARRPEFGGQLPSQGQGLLGRVSYDFFLHFWGHQLLSKSSVQFLSFSVVQSFSPDLTHCSVSRSSGL